MRFLVTIGVALGLIVALQAQTLQQYLKIRAHYKVSAKAPIAALDIAVGEHVIEVSGTVKGSAGGGEGGVTLLVESADKGTLFIRTTEMPSWMATGPVRARMLVHVSRKNEVETPNYLLLMAVAEENMSAWERDQTERAAKLAAKKQSRKSLASPYSGSKGMIGAGTKYAPKVRAGAISTSRGGERWVVSLEEAYPYYLKAIRQINPRLTDKEADVITRSILGFSARFGVDAQLVMAMVVAESGFNPRAVSRVGAAGLGQLMPSTARGMGVVNPYDPVENLGASINIIRNHMVNYGGAADSRSWDQIILTLAAYNAGSGAVKKYGGVPPYKETQNYIRRVISLYKRYMGIHD